MCRARPLTQLVNRLMIDLGKDDDEFVCHLKDLYDNVVALSEVSCPHPASCPPLLAGLLTHPPALSPLVLPPGSGGVGGQDCGEHSDPRLCCPWAAVVAPRPSHLSGSRPCVPQIQWADSVTNEFESLQQFRTNKVRRTAEWRGHIVVLGATVS
jgi:hypothetical protein